MEIIPRHKAKKFDARFTPYKRTPFDREEKLKISFDFDERKSHRERQEEESRKKLFQHRWREEQRMKAKQKKQNKREGKGTPQETWRDVLKSERPQRERW